MNSDNPETAVPMDEDDAIATAPARSSYGLLRWLADTYEQSQRVRIENGERIRAVVQSRDRTFEAQGTISERPAGEPGEEPESIWIDLDGVERTADETLADIQSGKTVGPVLVLGRSYQRHYEEERFMFKEMQVAIKSHPTYPWLSRVKGIGPTLAAKLLARLDATRAPYVSSFWAHAGLSTIVGAFYACTSCGLERSFPPTYNVTGEHKKGGAGARSCDGKLVRVIDREVRVARPRPAKGEKAGYDQYLKKVMYLVGTSFLKSGGKSFYEQHYRSHRARLELERPMWPDGRKHLTALRITEKLFLSHLWQVWRTALDLPTPAPWVVAHAGHDQSTQIDPWSAVTPEA